MRAEPLGVAPAHDRYPVQRWEPILEPLYAFRQEPPGIRVTGALAGARGVVRLALARPVADVLSPPRPGVADPGEWVLLVPCREEHCVATWQEAITSGAAGGFASLVIERRIGEVIPFRPDERGFQVSVEAMAPALLARREGNAGGLWVEALLVRACDEGCDVQWVLYTFGNVPAPTDADRRWFYCCNWLGCGPVWRPECTLRCASVSCP
jgi:hypothetical protein